MEANAQQKVEEAVILEEADLAVDKFIEENCHRGSVTQKDRIERELSEFIRFHLGEQERKDEKSEEGDDTKLVSDVSSSPPVRFALVTSGGTVAPLEKQEIRHVTNLSTGKRGSASCEHFLRLGYKVTFLHKTGCLMPFARHFQDGSFMKDISVSEETVDNEGDEGSRRGSKKKVLSFSSTSTSSSSSQSNLIGVVEEYQRHHVREKNILLVPFHTVADYQLAMKTTLCTFKRCLDNNDQASKGQRLPRPGPSPSMAHLMVYLVAAVADFYIPYSLLPAQKIDSKPDEDSMTIYLHKVPKALARGLVGRKWGGGSFVTTFKLETDDTRITEKVMKHINAFSNIKLVCANLLQDIRREIKVYDTRDPSSPFTIQMPPRDSLHCVEDALERQLVDHVTSKHEEFITNGSMWQ